MLSLLILSVALVAAMAVGIVLTDLINTYPALGLMIIGVVAALAWEVPQLPTVINVYGANLKVDDILAGLFIWAAARTKNNERQDRRAVTIVWACLIPILISQLLIGYAHHGIGAPTNDFRPFLPLIAGTSWALTKDWSAHSHENTLRRASMAFGWILTMVAGIHIAKYGLGSASRMIVLDGGETQTGRPLTSSQALLLYFSALECLGAKGTRGAWTLSGVVFLAVVVVAQQRTVWVSGTIGLALVSILSSHTIGRRARRIIPAALGAIITMWVSGVANLSSNSTLTSAAENSGTYDGRVTSWKALIAQSIARGIGHIVFGSPFGDGYGRFEGPNRWVEFAPHNWYLTIYLRAGLMGLSLLVLGLGAIMLRSAARRDTLALIGLVAIAVYGWTYFIPWTVSVYLAAAMIGRRPAAAPSPSPSSDSNPAGLAENSLESPDPTQPI